MNLAKLFNSYIQRRIRRRYPPLVRVGFHNMRDGMGTRSGMQAGVGAAMMISGYLMKRQSKRTLLYAGKMGLGQSMRVRVRRGAKVIDDFTVIG